MRLNLLNILATALLFTTLNTQAQAPDSFSYQSVVYNTSGELVTNQTISLQISIIKDSELGDVVYQEIHHPVTNNNGMISILVGEGSSSGNLADVDWSLSTYHIKSEIDMNNGTNYTISGIQQLLSVPYALHAKNAVEQSYIDNAIDSLSSLIDELKAYNIPTAEFTASSQVGGINNSISFSSTNTNNAASYLWTFEGGSPSTSTLMSPSVVYFNSGKYDTKLKVSNNFGVDEITKEEFIEILSVPEANFTASDTTVSIGESVTFTSTSTNNPAEYFWEFNNGSYSTSMESNPTVRFGNQGSFTISLTVKNLSGSDKETKTRYISCN